jgi:N-acyl-D-amino-acid deacylase
MFVALFILSSLFAPNYDLVLKNGTIVDGSGQPSYRADLAIKDGKIVAIGPSLTGANLYVDEKGQIIAPGFVDVHTHAENILKYPQAWNFIHDGVTTVIIGNCGGSTLKVKDFFSQLTKESPAINVATLVGHNSVRTEAMGGAFNRDPTKTEMETMEALVSEGMKEGAVGFSTGLEYVPGTYSKTSEIVDLAKIAQSFGGIYTSHMRSEGLHEKEALAETFEVGKDAAIPIEVSHIKLDCEPAWGQADARLKQISLARKNGIRVTQDVYPYIAYSTTLGLLVPSSAFDGGINALREKLSNPIEKQKILDGMTEIRRASGEADYAWVTIASNKDPRLNGLKIPEAARRREGSAGLAGQIALILELESEGGASGVFFAMDEDDLVTFMQNPRTMIISDSTVEALNGADVPHPRAYGSNARVLAEYVRKRHVMGLEEAIRRMTSLPAETFKIRDRGAIKEGYWADLTIFDPKKIQDLATFANPRVYPAGIKDVLVNGKFVIQNSAETGQGPGRPIRRDTP